MQKCDDIKIYSDYKLTIKYLKKKYKPERDNFNKYIEKKHRFPFVALTKDESLDKKAIKLQKKLEKHKLQKQSKKDVQHPMSHVQLTISPSSIQKSSNVSSVKKKSENRISINKNKNEDISLEKIYIENEELDFEENELLYNNELLKDNKQQEQTLENKKVHASKRNDIRKENSEDKHMKLSVKNNSNNSNISNNNYKIPKKQLTGNEVICQYVEGLLNNRRYLEGFIYLDKLFKGNSEEWKNEKIINLLAQIALGLSKSMMIRSDFDKLERIRDILISVCYTNPTFWHDILVSLDKKITYGNITHEIKKFLSGLYDFLFMNNIRMLQSHNELVYISYQYMFNAEFKNKKYSLINR